MERHCTGLSAAIQHQTRGGTRLTLTAPPARTAAQRRVTLSRSIRPLDDAPQALNQHIPMYTRRLKGVAMKNMLAIASLCLLSVSVAAGLAAPQSSTVEDQIKKYEQDWARATVNQGAAAVDKY